MPDPTDANTLNRTYWRAVAASDRESGPTRAIGDGPTSGLRAIDRAAVRRTLDAVLSRLRAEPECDCQTRNDVIDYILAMREDL